MGLHLRSCRTLLEQLLALGQGLQRRAEDGQEHQRRPHLHGSGLRLPRLLLPRHGAPVRVQDEPLHLRTRCSRSLGSDRYRGYDRADGRQQPPCYGRCRLRAYLQRPGECREVSEELRPHRGQHAESGCRLRSLRPCLPGARREVGRQLCQGCRIRPQGDRRFGLHRADAGSVDQRLQQRFDPELLDVGDGSGERERLEPDELRRLHVQRAGFRLRNDGAGCRFLHQQGSLRPDSRIGLPQVQLDRSGPRPLPPLSDHLPRPRGIPERVRGLCQHQVQAGQRRYRIAEDGCRYRHSADARRGDVPDRSRGCRQG